MNAEILIQKIKSSLDGLYSFIDEFQEKYKEQQCEMEKSLQPVLDSIYKVLPIVFDILQVLQERGIIDVSLLSMCNIVPVIVVTLTGVKFVAVVLSMLEADNKHLEANKVLIQQRIDSAKAYITVIKKQVDDMGELMGVMLALHQESAHIELEQVTIVFKAKLRETKFDLDDCKRALQDAKDAIGDSIKKLNFRLPLAATTSGVLGTAGIAGFGVTGFLLVPFGGIGIPIIMAAAIGASVLGAASLGAAAYAGTVAVKLAEEKKKFLIYKQQQERLSEDTNQLMETVKEYANMLHNSGIEVEDPWDVDLNWSLQIYDEDFTSPNEPSVGP